MLGVVLSGARVVGATVVGSSLATVEVSSEMASDVVSIEEKVLKNTELGSSPTAYYHTSYLLTS